MPKTISKFDKRVKEIKEVCEKEILSSEIAIPFYKGEVEKCENSGEKAKLELKLKQIEDSLAFNNRFIDYLKTL